MSRSGGYKCYNMSCRSCVGRTLCGETGDVALNCVDRIVSSKTNADRIRAMSDEELALFQANRYAEAIFREKADNGVFVSETAKKALVEKLYQVWFQYLRQPAEED